ncbi:unnamed protein product, partial [Urochloa humidicola]
AAYLFAIARAAADGFVRHVTAATTATKSALLPPVHPRHHWASAPLPHGRHRCPQPWLTIPFASPNRLPTSTLLKYVCSRRLAIPAPP